MTQFAYFRLFSLFIAVLVVTTIDGALLCYHFVVVIVVVVIVVVATTDNSLLSVVVVPFPISQQLRIGFCVHRSLSCFFVVMLNIVSCFSFLCHLSHVP